MTNIKANWLILYFTLFVCALGILLPIDFNIYWDQAVYLLHSKYFAGQEIGYNELLFRSPLISFITAPIWIFTSNILAFKLTSFVFTILFIYCVFKYFKAIGSANISIATSILLSSFGIIQLESKFFLTDIPALFFMFSSLWSVHSKYKYNFLFAGALFALTITTRLGYLYFTPIIALYYLFNMKNYKAQAIQALVGFLLIYSIYNIWIYQLYGTIFGNITKARFEGHLTATYSFEKINQIIKVTGYSTIILSLFRIFNSKKNDWLFGLCIIITTFIVIPYNPQNDRFIIPAIPFLLYFSLSFLSSLKDKKLQKCILFIFILEHSLTLIQYRSHLSYNSKLEPTTSQQISSEIKDKPLDRVYTNIFYPSIAFYSDKEVIVPNTVGHENDEFHFVDHAFLTKPGYVVTRNQGPMNKKYFESKKENFKFLNTVDQVDIYEYLGNFSKSIKQYRLFILQAPGNVYGHGKGFLELDGEEIKKFSMSYHVTPGFLSESSLDTCLKSKFFSFKFIDHIPLNQIKIVKKQKNKIWIRFKPNTINGCKYTSKSFELRYDLINSQN